MTAIRDGDDDRRPGQRLRSRSSGHPRTRSIDRDEEDNEADLVDMPTELGVAWNGNDARGTAAAVRVRFSSRTSPSLFFF